MQQYTHAYYVTNATSHNINHKRVRYTHVAGTCVTHTYVKYMYAARMCITYASRKRISQK
ncbi:hypothetical protein LOAG_08403, partial [Loa loa]